MSRSCQGEPGKVVTGTHRARFKKKKKKVPKYTYRAHTGSMTATLLAFPTWQQHVRSEMAGGTWGGEGV